MEKLYFRINWENEPSRNTALGARNLNKMDYAMDAMDNRIIEQDITKMDKESAKGLINGFELNTENGNIIISYFDGSTKVIHTNFAKIAVNITYDPVNERLVLHMPDGTETYVDMSSLITQFEFLDSDTIAFEVTAEGKVKANVRNGSIRDEHLQPNYLAEIKVQAENASASATSASQSAESSSQSAAEAQASAEAAARSAEEAKQAAGGDYVTHQEVGQPNGVAGLDENGKVPTDQLPEIGEKVVVDGTTIVKDEKTGEISVADEITKSISDTQKSLSDHTDSLVMSADGVHGLRYHEDKLEAKDSEGAWHEISTGGGGGGIPLAEPTNTSLENADESVVIKWTDPDDIVVSGSTIAKWNGTVIVRKVGSVPTSKTDGVLIVDSKVKNQYAESGYVDNGLDNGTEYFYGFFPYTDKNVYTTTKVSSITPSEIYPTAPSNVSVEKGNALATVSFTLAEDTTSAKIVYGTHAPTSPSDGTAIETTTSPYTIEGLVNDTTYHIVVYAFNAKGRYTASDVVEVTPKSLEIVTFADGTWEQIQAMLEAHYNNEINISDYWAVDDRRLIPVSAISATGVGESHHADTYEYAILGIEHDDLAEPINGHTKAAVTIGQVRCLTTAGATQTSGDAELGYMNSTNTNSGGWESCARRKWCNEVFFNALPDGLKSMVKTVKKYSGLGGGSSSGIQTTQDKVFLLSEIEIFGSSSYSVEGEGSQYPYFAISTSNRQKLPPWTSSYVSAAWWERSPHSGNSYNFCSVNVNGNANGSSASAALALAPNLCL